MRAAWTMTVFFVASISVSAETNLLNAPAISPVAAAGQGNAPKLGVAVGNAHEIPLSQSYRHYVHEIPLSQSYEHYVHEIPLGPNCEHYTQPISPKKDEDLYANDLRVVRYEQKDGMTKTVAVQTAAGR